MSDDINPYNNGYSPNADRKPREILLLEGRVVRLLPLETKTKLTIEQDGIEKRLELDFKVPEDAVNQTVAIYGYQPKDQLPVYTSLVWHTEETVKITKIHRFS